MRRMVLYGLTALVATACEIPAPVPTDLSETALEVPTAWSSTTTLLAAPEAWLADLADPVVATLVEEAVSTNFDLQAVAGRVQAARARARIVGALEQSRADFGTGASRRGTPSGADRRSTENIFDARVDAAWEFDLWDRLANETTASHLDADATAADYEAARLSLAAGVAQSWYRTVEVELQVELAHETVRNFRDNLAVVEENYRSGLSNALDVRLERANLAAAESRLEGRRVERNSEVRSLEVLLGRYPRAELEIVTELPTLQTEVPPGMPAEILGRRPDVRAAALRLEAGDARLSFALKNRLPSIVLTAAGGVTSGELRNLLDFDALLWSIAADLVAPLFRGGELAAERDLARAEITELLADYAQVVLDAFREVETALTAEHLLTRQAAALRVAAEESEAAEALALERYRSGLIDIITWLETRRRAFDAKSALLTVSNQRLQNRIALYLALGGDFAPPVPAVANADALSGPVP